MRNTDLRGLARKIVTVDKVIGTSHTTGGDTNRLVGSHIPPRLGDSANCARQDSDSLSCSNPQRETATQPRKVVQRDQFFD